MRITTFWKKVRRAFFLLLLLANHFAQSQTPRKPDVITLRDATKLEVLIQEVDENVVKYKKLTDPEGPLFSVRKTEIASIKYGNGDVETFEAVLEVPGYYAPNAPKASAPAPSSTAVTPKARFQEELQAATPDRLRAVYKYYKGKSKGGMIMGIAGTSAGILVAAIGTGIVASATDANGNFKSYQDEKRAIRGAWMMIGGFAGAVTFGTVGFVKAGKNGSKATRVRRELVKRNEPITFRISPAFNPVNGYAHLALSLQF
ncbi:hypothetical protein [Dyadobacter psychrophilus]|uniref:Uncharacterized protein n=1 Tax=Dyadobacter psychrophilus TaxID=651661 RepID=A0A1T5HF60_9BACT|nr:hypothetical protein [Dyadobacter psychrophilus]SKC19306.1 hypothetical protein SAMN05660293_05449 [Dyadobacter psychrophilus]